jgi:hypothetical protein
VQNVSTSAKVQRLKDFVIFDAQDFSSTDVMEVGHGLQCLWTFLDVCAATAPAFRDQHTHPVSTHVGAAPRCGVCCFCRLGTLSLLFIPALGWVAFNIAQPFFNQVDRMNEIKAEATGASSGGRKKRGLAGAVGMGAALSMFAAQQADAATEVAQLAGDNR